MSFVLQGIQSMSALFVGSRICHQVLCCWLIEGNVYTLPRATVACNYNSSFVCCAVKRVCVSVYAVLLSDVMMVH